MVPAFSAVPISATVARCWPVMALRMVSRPTEKQAQTFFSAARTGPPPASTGARAASATGPAISAASAACDGSLAVPLVR